MIENSFRLTKKQVEILLEAGSQAPSGGNTQPWKVKVFSDRLEFSLDPKRSVSFIDVNKTASLFSLGCFLENIEIAAQKLELAYKVSLDFSDLTRSIVVIKFEDNVPDNSRTHLFPSIKERVTNRQLYDGSLVDEKIINKFIEETREYNNSLKLASISDQRQKVKLAHTLGRADVIRMTNRKAYSQMIGEFRWSKKEVLETKDGLDLRTLEMPRNLAKIFTLIRKHHNIMGVLPKRVFEEISKPIIEGSSHVLCVYSSKGLSSEIIFEAGRVVERIWLEATSKGLAFQPWTIVTFFFFRVFNFGGEGFSAEEIKEIKSIREELNEIFNLKDSDMPLFIFRISKAKEPTARSLKLHWKDFTTFDKSFTGK
jgi:hypothetical protein